MKRTSLDNFERSNNRMVKVYFLSYQEKFWPILLFINPFFSTTIARRSSFIWQIASLSTVFIDYFYCKMLDNQFNIAKLKLGAMIDKGYEINNPLRTVPSAPRRVGNRHSREIPAGG